MSKFWPDFSPLSNYICSLMYTHVHVMNTWITFVLQQKGQHYYNIKIIVQVLLEFINSYEARLLFKIRILRRRRLIQLTNPKPQTRQSHLQPLNKSSSRKHIIWMIYNWRSDPSSIRSSGQREWGEIEAVRCVKITNDDTQDCAEKSLLVPWSCRHLL